MKLEVSLIPEGSWGKSLANLLPPSIWYRLRHEVYKRYNNVCGICLSSDKRLHCHEVWEFEPKKKFQILRGFISICEDCHSIIHWGRTVGEVNKGHKKYSEIKRLMTHFCTVNNVSLDTFNKHQRDQFDLVAQRSKIQWTIVWGRFSPERITRLYTKRNK